METGGEGGGGPLIIVVTDLIVNVDSAAFLNREGVQKVDHFPMGKIVQLFQNGLAIGVEKSLNGWVHNHHHTNYYNVIIPL